MRSRTQTALAAAVLTAVLGATTARAGEYHVYGCRTPAGEAAPADGWSGSVAGAVAFVEDTCSQPDGALIARLSPAVRTANTESATWQFGAPAGARIADAVLWRAGDADGGAAVNAFYEFWIAGPEDANDPENAFDQCVAGSECPIGVGASDQPVASANRLVVPAHNLGTKLYVNASCSGESGFKCKEGLADPNNNAAVVYVFASDITLEQAAGPSAGAVGGELASAPAVAGTSDVTFRASDPGAGVYEALVTVDGQLVQATPLDENGGRCRNLGQTADGSMAFLYAQPCVQSLSADVAVDTTRLSNGGHHLVVSVIDAAGNSATVLDRDVTVANPAGSGGAGQTSPVPGPANGTNASSQATLTVAWKGAHRSRLTTPYGRSETVLGRLLASGGAPIAGAQIEALATPGYAGAHASAMASPVTDAGGAFSVHIPAGASSRVLRFSYRAHLGDPLPAASGVLTLVVRAAVGLTISPLNTSAGHRIYFSGRLLGGPLPASGKLLVLEARSAPGGWIKFDVVHSDRAGRYRASYRFRFAGPATYRFRVVSEAESDYPYAAGASNTVVVREH
jgi:hypothetical protein